MIQQDLTNFLTINEPEIFRSIIQEKFSQGLSGRQIARDLGFTTKQFYRIQQKLNIANPNVNNIKIKVAERITLRKQGKSICEIANKQGVTVQAIYSCLKLRNPMLASHAFLQPFIKDKERKLYRTKHASSLANLSDLSNYRKKKFSVSAQRTNSGSKLWYIYVQKPPIRKYLGRILQQTLLLHYDLEYINSHRYLNLNPLFDENPPSPSKFISKELIEKTVNIR